jgi:(p)ppGpp synthase/HD superfamily hydrolase
MGPERPDRVNDPDDPGEASLEFLLGHRDRARAMADRLRWTAARAGLSMEDARAIGDCFLVAMRHRAPAIPDDHDPDYLHPARTALILIEDVGVRDPATLRAAVMHETSRPDLALDSGVIARVAGPEAAAIVRQLVPPDADAADLVETLVTAPHDVLALYLAGQLDHARHLHLHDPAAWREGHERVARSLLPLAQRCNPLLAKRFERWATAFRRRFLRPDP